MKYLRIILAVYALLSLTVAIFFFTKGGLNLILGVYLLINFTIIIVGTFFEKKYNPQSITKSGWEKTGEKFVDPGSNKKVEVHYNPKTGERKYVENKS